MADDFAFLTGGGETGALIRRHDWSTTPLGPVAGWPPTLRTVLGLCLRAQMPTALYWGEQLLAFHNDAWRRDHGRSHLVTLAQPARELLADIWPLVGAHFEEAFSSGRGSFRQDLMLPIRMGERIEETWWDHGVTPVIGEDGAVAGILSQAFDTTDRVIERRRANLLVRLNDRMRRAVGVHDLLDGALAVVGSELGVGRAGYAEVAEDGGAARITRCWSDGRMTRIAGAIDLALLGAPPVGPFADPVPIAIEDCRSDPRARDAATQARYAEIGLIAGLVVPIASDGRHRAALFANSDRPRPWPDHELVTLGIVARRIWQEVARARAENALHDSESRYRRIFEQANDIIFTTDLEQRVTACNPAAAAALEMTTQTLPGRHVSEFLSAADFERTVELLRHKLEKGGTTRYEVAVIAPSGRQMDWEVNSALTLDSGGAPSGLHAIARDVTERRRADERQRLLIHELNHRVKNTLAIVQGLALQSFVDDREPSAARATFEARLAALATAHDLLTKREWRGTTLRQLAEDTTIAITGPERRVALDGPELMVPPKAAVSLVMTLHELGTNAARHGALSRPEGQVSLAWQAADRLSIHWCERGGPAAIAPERPGFGLRLIQRALAADLDGRIDLEFGTQGFECRIDAALPAMPMVPAA